MATKQPPLSGGDTVSIEGEIMSIGDDGTVSVWLHGYGAPITIHAERVSLVAKRIPSKVELDRPN